MDIHGVILANDLLQWAEKAGATFRRSGSEWRSACPLHHGDNPSGFAVYQKDGKQHWKCFTGDCGQGDVMDFVQVWQNCDKQAAYQMLGGETQPDPEAVARHAQEQAARAIADLERQVAEAQRVLDELRRAQAWLIYHDNLKANQAARELWQQRGLPDDWQDFWELGYCPEFVFSSDGARVTSPTLAIPVKDIDNQVVNIRHRILQPINPNDKYRPDRPGLTATPFIGFPGLDADRVLVVEGEIKSMVTFATLWSQKEPIQVIGIPGKTAYKNLAGYLDGRDVYILFDPDALKEAIEAAQLYGGKYLQCPMKVDDAINAGALDKAGIKRMLQMGRKA